MVKMLKKPSPAKINLFLRVLGKRPDGYHNIFSLMQKITLCDELTFLPRSGGIVLKCPNSDLPVSKDNLVFRAAESILSYAGCSSGVEIILTKYIPAAAGLGGGSSDAATTLLALNEMYQLGLTKAELMQLGAKLGADVPFFIFGDSAFAAGIGDQLTAWENPLKLNIVLINPLFPLPTKLVYESLNLRLTKEKINYSIPRLSALSDITSEMHNDLEAASFKMHAELIELKQLLLRHGALSAMMSGSGPTVFGIFTDEITAKKTAEAIKKEVPRQFHVFFVQSL
ncbi:MAG: 4-(cytidine 5'-diphospho)-2-C-methyl-D-erythritol kinase [Smithellaceae bacterium]